MKKLFLMSILFVLCLSCSADDGRYETRSQSVLVCPAHYEQVWVGPVYSGPYIIQSGYWSNYWVPARYEHRLVHVWVPVRRGGGSFNFNWNWRTW